MTSHSKNKERKELMNTTAPINFNMGGMNSSAGGVIGGSSNHVNAIYSTKSSLRN